MEIQVVSKGKIGLLNLPQYFDFNDKNYLLENLPQWTRVHQIHLLVLNFTQTEFIGSSGVYPMFQFLAQKPVRCGRKKVRYAIIGLCQEYERLLEGMGIRKKFFLYNTSVNFAEQASKTLKLSKSEARSILEWL
jgi:anti-anti-sigma regulatory factor